MYQAHIILLPKPRKDPKLCTSYRLISILNYDFKVLTKVLATKLMKPLPSLVSIDKTGFIPGKSTDINLRRVLTHMQLLSNESALGVPTLLDVAKAFDSVDWVYMSSVLEVMGFGPRLHTWIKILYRTPTAQASRKAPLVKAIQVDLISEKVMLCADDLVLVPNDLSLSLSPCIPKLA